MRFSGNYLTLGVSVEQDELVLQTYLSTGRPMPAATFALAEIDTWNAGEAVRYVGIMVLAAVSVMSAAMQRHPYHHLLRENVERLPSTVRYGAAPVRPVRLRAILAPEPDRLLIQRCSNPVVADATLQELLLARLVLSGPAASVRTVGTTVLSELAAMHPDVFSRYPSLLGSNAPRCHE